MILIPLILESLKKLTTLHILFENLDVMIMMIMMILAQVIIPSKKANNHPPNNYPHPHPPQPPHPPNGHLLNNHIQVHQKNKSKTWRHRDSTIEILSIIVY